MRGNKYATRIPAVLCCPNGLPIPSWLLPPADGGRPPPLAAADHYQHTPSNAAAAPPELTMSYNITPMQGQAAEPANAIWVPEPSTAPLAAPTGRGGVDPNAMDD